MTMGATNIDTLVCPPAIFMGAQVLYGITALLSLERTKEGILIQYVHGYGRQPTLRETTAYALHTRKHLDQRESCEKDQLRHHELNPDANADIDKLTP